MKIHQRLSLSAVSSAKWDLGQDLAFWEETGCKRVGVSLSKIQAAGWDRGIELIRAADGLAVSSCLLGAAFHLDQPQQWAEERADLVRAVDASVAMGAGCLYMTTGPPGALTTDTALEAFHSAVQPALLYAKEVGLSIAVEHVSTLSRDIGCLNSLTDAIDLAEEIGMSICVEINNCWFDRRLPDLLRSGSRHFGLVQVSDFVVGTKSVPERAVPGDGDIPIEAIVSALLDAGYKGDFDLEILGPRIEEEGYPSAIPRGLAYMTEILDRLGA
jgi:sugar phosphate isomerase/epimerase